MIDKDINQDVIWVDAKKKDLKFRPKKFTVFETFGDRVEFIINFDFKNKHSKGIFGRFRHWLKKNKGCSHCCLFCEFFNECKDDLR